MRPGRAAVAVASLAAAAAAPADGGGRAGAPPAAARTHATETLTVLPGRQHDISPLLYGIFFEDIQFSADGGLYAELVRNRDFEALGRGGPTWPPPRDTPPPTAGDMHPWSATGEAGLSVSLTNATHPFAANPTVLHVTAGSGGGGVSNPGWWGINARPGVAYDLTLYARSAAPAGLRARLVGGGRVLASAQLSVRGAWRQYAATLSPTGGDTEARLEVVCDGACDVYLDHVSLFPGDAVAGLFRADVFAALAALRPAFLRFPGGNYVEGTSLGTRWAWKRTVGARQGRPGHYNSAWGYWVTDGMGLYEYLALAEALGAEAQFTVYSGYSMGPYPYPGKYVPLNQSGPFIQDAVDAAEFANGAETTPYGRVRGEMGHPAPFRLARYEIGNEENDMAEYLPHYRAIEAALRAAQPGATVIASGRWGGSVDGSPCTACAACRCDLWDDHYYRDPDAMARMVTEYDSYNRSLPAVFVGEYAGTKWGPPIGHHQMLRNALAEALFMIGFERNADAVRQASFGALLRHANGTEWDYALLAYDSARVFGIPSYAVQRLFAEHRGDATLAVEVGGGVVAGATASVRRDGAVIVKAVGYGGPGGVLRVVPPAAGAARAPRGAANVTVLSGEPDAQNSLLHPAHVAPVTSAVAAGADGAYPVAVAAWSLVIVTIPPPQDRAG